MRRSSDGGREDAGRTRAEDAADAMDAKERPAESSAPSRRLQAIDAPQADHTGKQADDDALDDADETGGRGDATRPATAPGGTRHRGTFGVHSANIRDGAAQAVAVRS